jgi:predicted transcriptional regulator
MQVVTFKADEELVEKLDALADEQHTTRSQLIRSAIEEYVESEMRIAEAPSAYEAMKDVIGCIEGPGDLSTNPKYMEGYGE